MLFSFREKHFFLDLIQSILALADFFFNKINKKQKQQMRRLSVFIYCTQHIGDMLI